jgi:hypothetical protein
MGIRDRPFAPASPWQNGYAERLLGSIRRECLEHMINFESGYADIVTLNRWKRRELTWIATRRSATSRLPTIAVGLCRAKSSKVRGEALSF